MNETLLVSKEQFKKIVDFSAQLKASLNDLDEIQERLLDFALALLPWVDLTDENKVEQFLDYLETALVT